MECWNEGARGPSGRAMRESEVLFRRNTQGFALGYKYAGPMALRESARGLAQSKTLAGRIKRK
jgi:hypothetical protein